MEASIRDPNIKNFVRLIQCAARYGDDLCMHATKDSWDLSVTNSSKSAFCLFTLKPAFFSRYRPIGTPEQQRRGVKCQLYAKSVLGVLGKASGVNAVDRLDLKIVDPEGGLRSHTQMEEDEEEDDIRVAERSAQLELKLTYNHDITKKHFLHLQSSDCLQAVVDKDSMPSGFMISARTLRDWLEHFNIAFSATTNANGAVRGESQLAWRFGKKEVCVKTFENASTSSLSTEVKLNVGEFGDDYEVFHEEGRVDLALPMREFKATLQLAVQLGMDLDFCFSEARQPISISSTFHGLDKHGSEKELFSISCVIATTDTEAFANAPAPSAPRANGSSLSRAATRSREPSVKPKLESDRTESESASVPPPSRSRRAESSRAGSSRSRASLSMAAQPAAPDAMVTVVGGSFAAASQAASQAAAASQRGNRTANAEPLFLPTQSQGETVRMTQQEVLDMAGVGDIDLEAMFEDADADDPMDADVTAAADVTEVTEMDNGVPADWDEFEFNNLPADNMSTQQQQQQQQPRQPTQQQATAPSPERPTAAPSASAQAAYFEPDSDIFGETVPALAPGPSQRRVPSPSKLQTPAPSVRHEAVQAAAEEMSVEPEDEEVDELDDEEFDADAIDATQPSGRKFESLFKD